MLVPRKCQSIQAQAPDGDKYELAAIMPVHSACRIAQYSPTLDVPEEQADERQDYNISDPSCHFMRSCKGITAIHPDSTLDRTEITQVD
jgi:hypothetical protein